MDRSDGVKDGGVIASSEVTADLGETKAGESAGEEHADLPGERDALVAFFALKIALADAVVFRDGFVNLLDGDSLAFGAGGIAYADFASSRSMRPFCKRLIP